MSDPATVNQVMQWALSGRLDKVTEEYSKLRAENARLRAALQGLIDGVTAEVNEKGGSGYILARLSDARRVLERRKG